MICIYNANLTNQRLQVRQPQMKFRQKQNQHPVNGTGQNFDLIWIWFQLTNALEITKTLNEYL